MQQGRQDKRNYFSVCGWRLGVWRPGRWGCSHSDASWRTLLGIHLYCVPAVQMSSVSVGASRSCLLRTPCITLSLAAPEVLLQRCLQTPAGSPLGTVVEEEWGEYQHGTGHLGREKSLRQQASSFPSALLPGRQ